MKILIVMRHSGYLRNFESTIRLLCDRGHKVELAFQAASTHWLLDASDVASTLEATYPRFTRSVIPERTDAWGSVAHELRRSLDYLRYLGPAYRDAPKLRERATREVPEWMLARTQQGIGATRVGRRVLAAGIRRAHRAIPCDARISAFLEVRQPDLLVVTPLIQPGAPQAEYLRSARALGVRTAFCVASWDNLTNKGLIHGPVDLITVWNEAMKREAVDMHGAAPAQVTVTGAQPFDHWFGWSPSGSREDFCRRVGLPAERPYVLYLCSSRFIAPEEVPFVRRWIEHLRAATSPALRNAGVLIRPHPQNADQWRTADLRDLGAVSVWPPEGAAPSDDAARAEYFDSIHHSAAVVGINTTAEIESAIIGRGVYTVLAPEFRDTQEGTLHFHHLREDGGGLVQVARDLSEHVEQLEVVLRDPDANRDRCRRFVESFVRPFGLDTPSTPRLVRALETLAAAPAPAPERLPWWAPLAQPVLARRGEHLQHAAFLNSETKARRAAVKARRKQAAARDAAVPPAGVTDVPSPEGPRWRRVAEDFRALGYHDRIRFGKYTRRDMPGELLREHITPERLDYPGATVLLQVTSKAERNRLRSCAKEPFTIEWIETVVRPDDVVYDIGANIGVYSLVAALRPGGGARVFAFEPSYANVASLCANVALNRVADRVTPLPVALGDETGLRTLGLLSLEPGTARHALGEPAPDEGPVEYHQPVLAWRLDDAAARFELPPPNHIKLDVDGAELAVLDGASRTLASPTLRSLLIEVGVSVSDELVGVLARHGWRLDHRFAKQDAQGVDRVWYGLFTRETSHVSTGPDAGVTSAAR